MKPLCKRGRQRYVNAISDLKESPHISANANFRVFIVVFWDCDEMVNMAGVSEERKSPTSQSMKES
jgi:hypothetical protein